jgi:hypothetical protein
VITRGLKILAPLDLRLLITGGPEGSEDLAPGLPRLSRLYSDNKYIVFVIIAPDHHA